ncbi:MAG: DUF4838 domain-containing protein [Armatimonadota bacterium]
MSFKSIAILATVTAIVSSTAAATQAATLAKDSKTTYTIVIAKDAISPEKQAALELSSFLEQVTGAKFPVRSESEVKQNAPQILVGQSNPLKKLAPDVNWAALGSDGIVIRTVGNNLLIAGGRPRGTIYAVYSFLEDTVGFRWWTSTESYTPSKRTLIIPELNIIYSPKLISREVFYRDVIENPQFAVKLKINGNWENIPEAYGGHQAIIGWCHTFNQLLPPDKYFAAHPDWYSEIDGKRVTNAQLCLTSDKMRKELTRVALERIRENPNAGLISISQNDLGGGACQCPKCKAIDEEEGSSSGTLIRFVNKVAEDIEKDYPNMLVETLAYQYTLKPPLHEKPRHNVIIRLCSINCDFAQPLDSNANSDFRDDINKWSKIAPKLYVWDYVTDFSNYIQPQPNMQVLGPNIRFFTKHNTIGLFEQGDTGCTIGDFVRLRAWVLSHLVWNPALDQKQLTSEFLKGYYGNAAPYLQSYLDLMQNAIKDSRLRLSCYNKDLSFLTLPVMTEATGLFDQAAKAVADDPVVAKRVQREQMPLDLAWLLRYDALKKQAASENAAFAGPSDLKTACQDFIKRAQDLQATNYSESSSFDSYIPLLTSLYQPPAPSPKEFSNVPLENIVDVQDCRFTVYEQSNWAKHVDDPKASDGKAVFMPGSHVNWAIRYTIPSELTGKDPNEWQWYVVARTEGAQSGDAFTYGVYDEATKKTTSLTAKLEQGTDGEYHTYCLGSLQTNPNMYIWISPTGDGNTVKGIYVDRIMLVRKP